MPTGNYVISQGGKYCEGEELLTPPMAKRSVAIDANVMGV